VREDHPVNLVDRATAVLRANDRGRYTVPAGHLYPHQWAWDSAFAAIGWSIIDVDRGLVELETLLAGAWSDWRVPHIRFHDPTGVYFPGPAFWGTEDRSSISQPPIWAAAARRVLERGGDPERVRALLAPIARSHQWFLSVRDPLDRGLVAVGHPWESGMDNSPAWTAAMRAIDPASAPSFERVDQQHVAHAAQRPTDDEYLRYAALVTEIAANGFGLGSFAVYDPGMSAILAWADGELATLAGALGDADVALAARRRHDRVSAGLLEHLWDDELGRFVFVDALTGLAHAPNVVGSYLPLLIDLPESHAARLRAGLDRDFSTPWPVPTTAPTDPAFDPVGYWRGPMWVNINWLLDGPLAGGLRASTIELIEHRGCREYFDPLTGDGLGADDFSWTAAIALDWLAG
jgi:glycogen debranching enzyme